jgi:hypothetical protein
VHQARFYAAEAHFNRREYLTAASRFSALAGDLGRAELAAQARFMACRSYEELAPGPQLDQEYTRAAIDHCQALVDYFPDSEHAEDATASWTHVAPPGRQGVPGRRLVPAAPGLRLGPHLLPGRGPPLPAHQLRAPGAAPHDGDLRDAGLPGGAGGDAQPGSSRLPGQPGGPGPGG